VSVQKAAVVFFLRDGKKIRDVKLVVRDCSFSDDYRGEEVLTEAGTILERVSAMGLWLEAAPPQIITVERICSPRPRTLDTIAEESMTMIASHLASSTETADHVLRPMSFNWESTRNSRLASDFVACN
jgi:hypothetical protein